MTQAFCRCVLETLTPKLRAIQRVRLPCRSWRGMTVSESSALGVPSRAMHADHPLGRDLYGSFLSQWLSNGGAYCRVPTPHARVPRDLGFSLLITGVWPKNHLSLSIFIVEVSRPEDSTPCPCAAPSTVVLTREHKETLFYPVVLSRGPTFGVPSLLTSVNARGRSTPEDCTVHKPPVSRCQLVKRRDYGLALLTYVASRDRTCTVH